MRILLTLLTAISLSTLACADANKAKRRERGGLSQADYNQLKTLNTMLADNEDALSEALAPKFMGISGKAQAMAQKIKEGGCYAKQYDRLGTNFTTHWVAIQEFEGPDTCPIYSRRYWEYLPQALPDTRVLVMRHMFTTKPSHKEFLNQTGIKLLSAGSGRISAKRDANGTTTIKGGMRYESFELANGVRLSAEVRTNQSYSAGQGRGSVTVTISQPGAFSHSGGVSWDARDFSERRYFAEDGDINRENFLELFSFFRMDEFVDNSLGMR